MTQGRAGGRACAGFPFWDQWGRHMGSGSCSLTSRAYSRTVVLKGRRMKKQKLLAKALDIPKNMPFREMLTLVEAFGFTRTRE